MGKGKSNANSVGATVPKNLDSYTRMNFLIQASLLQHNSDNTALARYYYSIIKGIAEKSVLRMYVCDPRSTILWRHISDHPPYAPNRTPEVKECGCKYCNTVLAPGDMLSVRTKRTCRDKG